MRSLINAYGLAKVGSKKGKDDQAGLDVGEQAGPEMPGVMRGEWGAIARQDLTTVELSNLAERVKSLGIPPVGPRLGVLRVDGKPYSIHSNPVNFGGRGDWKPKVDCLAAQSR